MRAAVRCPTCGEEPGPGVVRCPRDGSRIGDSFDPLAGTTLAGRYRLIAQLGRGGMSSVYLARHVLIDRLSAVKILRHDLSSDPLHRDRFLREARAVNRIQHENIIEITDYGETDDGTVFLVMEYVPGVSLLSLVARGRVPALRAVGITCQLAAALSRAHQMNVVHRDLKPDNVLLVARPDGVDQVKILDFGIAKILDAPSLTQSERIFGTPGYVAPEYAAGGEVTPRVDLYSLGVLLYEMVTSRLPFDATHPGELLLKVLREAPIPPRQRVATLPARLEALILRCLAKDPTERHHDAFHLLEDLQSLRAELSSATPAGAPETPAGLVPIASLAKTVPGGTAPAPRAVAPETTPYDDLRTLVRIAPASLPPAASEVPTFRLDGIEAPDPEAALDGPVAWSEVLDRLHARLQAVPVAQRPPAVTDALGRMAAVRDGLCDDCARAGQLRLRLLELEARGRDFRATIGRAMDALARDRSARARERDDLSAKRDELSARRAAGMSCGASEAESDALLWEIATCDELLRAAVAGCEDLEYQLRELSAQMDRLSEALEVDQGALVEDLERTRQQVGEHDAALRAALYALHAGAGTTGMAKD